MLDIVHENGIWIWDIHGIYPALNIQNMGEQKHGETRSENDRHLFMMGFSTSNCKRLQEGKSEVFSVCVMFFGLEGFFFLFGDK